MNPLLIFQILKKIDWAKAPDSVKIGGMVTLLYLVSIQNNKLETFVDENNSFKQKATADAADIKFAVQHNTDGIKYITSEVEDNQKKIDVITDKIENHESRISKFEGWFYSTKAIEER